MSDQGLRKGRGGCLALAAVLLAGLAGSASGQTAGMGGGMMSGQGMMGAAGMMGVGGVGAGHHLYMQDCAVCHRPDGAGGRHLGKAISADLRAPALETMYHNDDQLLARAILTGVAEDGGRLDPVMPRWANRLSPADVAEIIAYLKQLKG